MGRLRGRLMAQRHRWIGITLGVFMAFVGLALAWIPGCRPAPSNYQGQSPVTFLSGGGSDRFARVTAPRPFDLPRDHAAHEDTQIEWWYFTGNLTDARQRRFGFELTFFRIGLVAETPDTRTSRWATDQLYMAHFAVTDLAAGRFHAFERLTREGLDLAGWAHSPLRVWNEDWCLEARPEPGSRDPFPMRIAAADRDPEHGAIGIDLNLVAVKPLVLQGDQGFSPKGPEPGNASYYLQSPRLNASGTVTVGASRFEVTGLAWMDHEWSTTVLGPELAGWDWFALQLEDGRDVMVYQLRGKDGRPSATSAGTIVEGAGVDGSVRVTRLSPADFSLDVTRRWRSPHTGAEYPAGWRLRIPKADLDLTVTPALADQELRLSTSYWEGAVIIEGPAGAPGAVSPQVMGRGYVELVGYVADDSSE